jgi:hypothetical protein
MACVRWRCRRHLLCWLRSLRMPRIFLHRMGSSNHPGPAGYRARPYRRSRKGSRVARARYRGARYSQRCCSQRRSDHHRRRSWDDARIVVQADQQHVMRSGANRRSGASAITRGLAGHCQPSCVDEQPCAEAVETDGFGVVFALDWGRDGSNVAQARQLGTLALCERSCLNWIASCLIAL